MRAVIELRQSGNTVLRQRSRRRRTQLHHVTSSVCATLLVGVIGVQLVVVGRYTIFLVIHPHLAAANLSSVDDDSAAQTPSPPATSSPFYVFDDRGTDARTVRFNLPEVDLRATNVVRTVGNRTCFVEGLEYGRRAVAGGCPCKRDWFGDACSVPGFINRSSTPWSKDALRLRSTPRRVIQALPFNIEFDMLELRFAELADVVDVFLILESNYTAYGAPKQLPLLERLHSGSYPHIAHKIVYILLDQFPPAAHRDGWIADALHRNYLGTRGLRRLGGLRGDDLLVLNDADELPCRQLISFLRWHDGYSEPVAITYRWFVYGFFWTPSDSTRNVKIKSIPSVITVAMAIYVFRYQIYMIRSAPAFIKEHQFDVSVYMQMFGKETRRVQEWTAGSFSDVDATGWHCSWCLHIDGIITKFVSAQNGDFPRWGDYADKRNATYVRGLVARGVWFDDVTRFRRRDVISGPPALLANERRYWRLIHNVFADNSSTKAVTRMSKPESTTSRVNRAVG